MKIKPTESEAEHWFCLWLRRLQSSENCIVRVASTSGRINQWQHSIPGFAIGWFFPFCFLLRQLSFHWIITDGVVNGIGRNGNVLILLTPIPSSLWLRLRLRFLIFTRSWALLRLNYNSDSDSVASENQPSLYNKDKVFTPGVGGGNSHLKETGVLVVLFRVVKSRLIC